MFSESRAVRLVALALLASGCGAPDPRVDDPVAGVPAQQQRRISRRDLGFRWPLSVGAGVVACDERSSVLFRTQGVTYHLTGSPGEVAAIEPLRVLAPDGGPSNPLRRIRQDERMLTFRTVMDCTSMRKDADCTDAALRRFDLTRDEWGLIEAEGKERHWPPLSRQPMPLDPLVEAGRALCRR